LRTRSPTLVLLSCLALLNSSLTTGGSFTHFLTSTMARVKSTTHHVVVAAEVGNKGCESGGSAERMDSAQLSDADSHSGADGNVDDGSRTRSYYFGPSTVIVCWI
jgi:hypothetical protein